MLLTLFNAIFRRLKADAKVGPLLGSRIWNGDAKDNCRPLATVEISQEEDDAIDEKPAPHWHVHITLNVASGESRDAIADAVRCCLNRQCWTDQNVSVVSSLLLSDERSESSDSENAETQAYLAEMSFNFIASY